MTPSTDTDKDKGQFLGYAWDGTEVRSNGLPVDTVRQIKAIYQECVHTVNRECTFIFFDDQDGEDTIADAIRDSQAVGSCPDERTGFVYEVGTSGVAACNPARNPPPFHKDNFNKFVRGFLHSRCAGSGAKAQSINSTDISSVTIAKKDGNHAKMQNAFSHNKVRMPMTAPSKVLLNAFHQSSADHRGKRKHEQAFAAANSGEWQNTLVISREPLGTGSEVKARKHHEGDNSSAVIGFISELAMDSPLEPKATPEEKPGIIGAENTLLGSGGSYVSAESEPGYQSMPG